MNKKKICLLVLVALVSVFMLSTNVFAADVYCTGLEDARIDESIPKLVSTIVTIIQIVIPILLVVLGMMDFLKAVSAQKEDEIKKGQQTFIKRIIAAVLVFFVIALVKLVISLVATDDTILDCVDCFLNGPEDCLKQPSNGDDTTGSSDTIQNAS